MDAKFHTQRVIGSKPPVINSSKRVRKVVKRKKSSVGASRPATARALVVHNEHGNSYNYLFNDQNK